jgi:hypothetical protein
MYVYIISKETIIIASNSNETRATQSMAYPLA